MRNVGSTIVSLSEQGNRVPISKIEFDISGLSEEELLDSIKLTFEEFTQEGGTGAANGFLFGSHDENQTEYVNSSCLGVFDYDVIPDDGGIILAGCVDDAGGWMLKIKQLTDPTDASQWSWDGATDIGPYDGDLPRSIMVWYIGGVDNKVGVLITGGERTSQDIGVKAVGDYATDILKIDGDIFIVGNLTLGIANAIVKFSSIDNRFHTAVGGVSGFPENFVVGAESNPTIYSIVKTSDGMIYMGGSFSLTGDSQYSSCVAWLDPVNLEWHVMNGGVTQSGLGQPSDNIPIVNRLVATSNDNIVVVGDFNFAGGNYTQGIAVWSHIEQRWLPDALDGIVGTVQDIDIDSNNIIYVCGDFTGYALQAEVAKASLNGSWEEVGDGINRVVEKIAVSGDGSDIYIGCEASVTRDYEIFKYNIVGPAWDSLGELTIHKKLENMRVESDGNLYVGGDQLTIDGDNVRGFGYYDGAWKELGGGMLGCDVIGWDYQLANEILVVGDWWAGPNGANSNVAQWDGTNYQPLLSESRKLHYIKCTNYTTFDSELTSFAATEEPAQLLREVKPISRNTGIWPVSDEIIAYAVSIDGENNLEYISIAVGMFVLGHTLGTVGVFSEYERPLSEISNPDGGGFYIYIGGHLSLSMMEEDVTNLYRVYVSGDNVSPPELIKTYQGSITSFQVTGISNKYYLFSSFTGEEYTDKTGALNTVYREFGEIDNLSVSDFVSTYYKTRYGGAGDLRTMPGTISIVCDNVLYTVGGLGHGTVSPYGPHFIQKLVETDLLAISDDILSWTLSHSGPNTAAQLSLEVANANGKWNDSIVFHLGSTLILYAGYNDGTDDHYAEIARFTISSINNQITMGEQQIGIEANDYLTQLSQTQASTLQQYSSQLINKVNFYYSNPFNERELVSIRGQWAYQSNVQIMAANLSDSSSAEAKYPVVYMAETGATVGDVDIEFRMYISNKDRGLGGVIVAGNPADLEDGSLVVLMRARDTIINIYVAVLKKTDNIAPLSLQEGHLFSSLGSMNLYTAPQQWIYYRVRKQGGGIYVWWGTDGVNYTYLGGVWVGFSPQWYKDNKNRGHVGLYAAPYRDTAHSNREVYFGQFNSYSLEKSQTVANIMWSIITNAYSGTDVVDTVSGFEKRFEDDFADGIFTTTKWRFTTSENINTYSVEVDSDASNGYALKLTSATGQWGRVNYEMTGHNRCFTIRAKMSNTLAISVRCAASPGPSEFSQGHTFFLRRDSNWVWVSKHTGTTSGTWSHIRSLDPIPTIGTGYHTYTVTTLGKWLSLWIDDMLVITVEDTNIFAPATSTITEYYGVGTADTAWIDYIKNDSLDTVITGLDGIIGFTINPGDFYNTKMEELADTCAGLYFMRGNTFIAGKLVPPADSVDVFDSGTPYEFKDNLFQYGNEISSEDWYTAVQVIDAEGKEGPLIVDPDADSFSYKKTYIHFAEGVTDSSELWDIGQHVLEEKKRNRRRESFKGFGQLALELRDRANIEVHRIPTDDSSPLDIDISRLVNSYTLAFSRGDGPDLSLDVELVE